MPRNGKYDVLINSYGIGSIMAASYLSDRGVEVLLVDHSTPVFVGDKQITAHPYEIPIISLESEEYSSDLMSFVGLDDMNRSIMIEAEPIGVVFRDVRIDFKYPYMIDDIKRAFGPLEENRFHKLMNELKARSERRPCPWKKNDKNLAIGLVDKARHTASFRGMDHLYDKYDICTRLRGIVNSIIFVMSGVYSDNYRLAEASRTISCALNGVGITNSNVFSSRSHMMELVKGKVDVEHSDVSQDVTEGLPVIDDMDTAKEKFMDEFDRFKGQLSDKVMYPLSLYCMIDEELLSSAMPKFVIYIDADGSDYFEPSDVYVLRTWPDGENTCVQVTSFVPFGLFDIEHQQHRERLLKMRAILQKLIPNALKFDVDYYPDIDGSRLGQQLSKGFENIRQEDIIYNALAFKSVRPSRQKKILRCGREQYPYLGFDGVAASAITVSERILRDIKK